MNALAEDQLDRRRRCLTGSGRRSSRPWLERRLALLSVAGDVTGAIYVDNLTPVGSYTDEDLDFLISFGGIAAAALENSRLSEALRSKAVVLSNFERYFAPDLAASIAGERAQIQVGGDKRPVAVLFSDINGFTPMSERMAPERLVALLNDRDVVPLGGEPNGRRQSAESAADHHDAHHVSTRTSPFAVPATCHLPPVFCR